MASNLNYTVVARNEQLDALTAEIGNAALLRIYSGTQPANADAAVGAGTLLAELTCGSPFAGAASSGALTANAITSDSSANATGTAAWFRLVKSDGTTAVLDGEVGTSGADLNLNNLSIASGQTVSVSSFVITGGNA